MINELNLNHKVGKVIIRLNSDNPINNDIIRIMINMYHNLYSIVVRDNNDSVDNKIHDQIK